MPISGLVVTLAEDERSASEALRAMGRDPRLQIGVREGRKQALVAETASRSEDKALWSALQSEPGVTHVDVVFIHLDEDSGSAAPGGVSAGDLEEIRKP